MLFFLWNMKSFVCSTTSQFSTPKPTDSTTNLYETSSTITSSFETLISSSRFRQMPSTSYQKIDSTSSIVVSPSSGKLFLLIQKFKISFRFYLAMALACSSNCCSSCMFNRFWHLVLLFLSFVVSSYFHLMIQQKKKNILVVVLHAVEKIRLRTTLFNKTESYVQQIVLTDPIKFLKMSNI